MFENLTPKALQQNSVKAGPDTGLLAYPVQSLCYIALMSLSCFFLGYFFFNFEKRAQSLQSEIVSIHRQCRIFAGEFCDRRVPQTHPFVARWCEIQTGRLSSS
jgi:hypothetical protein